MKEQICDGKEIICNKCNRKFYGEQCFKTHLKNRSKVENKSDTVCDSVEKCCKCERIITGKFIRTHKCGYKECTNCGKYVFKVHKCCMKKIKVKGGHCPINKNCKINKSIKKKGAFHVDHTQKCLFYYFECSQNTGTHKVT